MKKKAFSQKPSTRILSLILCLLILFFATPSTIFAEVANTTNGVENTDSSSYDDIDIYSYAGEAFEAESMREENTKYFHLEDGTYVAAQYNYPVHYTDEDGAMQDIDNQLAEAAGGVFANKNARIKFAKKITGNNVLFTLHDGNTKLTLSLNNANKGVTGTVTNNDDASENTQLQKMMNLEKLSSSVIYKDILSGVDIEYVAHSNNIKENIIVKEKTDTYIYSFELKLNGLSAELLGSGDIQVVNEKTDDVQYVIPAPVVFDSNGEHSPAELSHYTLDALGGGKYSLSVTVSSEWMNDADRAFPVTIDPAIVASNSSVLDTSISATSPDSSSGSSMFLPITSTGYAFWKTTALPEIPSSAYITSATIAMKPTTADGDYVAAYEVLTDWDESLTWNQHTNSTAPKGQLGDTLIDYNYFNSNDYYPFNITPLVKSWYSETNYGVAFSAAPGQSVDVSLLSSETTAADRPVLTITYKDMKGTEDYWSYSSHSAGVAGTGSVNLATGQLTLAIPTLSTTDSLMPYTPTLVYNSSMAGRPYTYAYAETANRCSYMPFGFKLNICETVIGKSFIDNTGTTVSYYVYADADGTEHGFYASGASSSVYVDEDGMQKTLTVQSDGSLAITDDTKWTRTFTKDTSVDSSWYLSKITDEVGNAIIFTFDSSLRPTKVSMKPVGSTQIDFLELYYNAHGTLRMIYNPASKDAVVFRYSAAPSGPYSSTGGDYLRQIDYAHGNPYVTLTNWENFASVPNNQTNITIDATAGYEYGSVRQISHVYDDLSQQYLQYLGSGARVMVLRQYTYEEELGQSIYYTYGTKYTDVQSSGNDDVINTEDDITTRYVFDDVGRSTSVYSFAKNGTEVYGATVGKYETQENVKNNLKEQTVIGGTGVNYLLNGDFEQTSSSSSFDHWVVSGAVSRANQFYGGDGYYCASFSPRSGATASLTQYVSLTAGEYTLSVPYRTQISDNVTGLVEITSTAGSGFSHSEKISLNQNMSNGIESVFSTSFTVPSYTNGGDKLKITIKFTAAASDTTAPAITVDKVALVNNLGASKFSLVSYGSFDASVLNASGTATPLSSYWKTEANAAPTLASEEALFGASAKVTGQINAPKYIKQRIYQISDSQLDLYDYQRYDFISNIGYEYIVSGFASAANAVYSDNAIFRIRVDVIYYQGVGSSDVTISYYFDFTPSCTGWQFTGGSFNTRYTASDNNDYSCVRAIDVYCEYSYQPLGYALFDNISVVNSDGSDVERYYYYAEGSASGLLARKENIFYIEYYEYDGNRNLSRVANNRGELTDYYYVDGTNKVDLSFDYDFVWGSSTNYPYAAESPDAEITKTPKTSTTYSYDNYGLTTEISTYALDQNLNRDIYTTKLYSQYTYDTTAGSKKFGALIHEKDGLDIDIYYYYDNTNGRLLATVNGDEGTGVCYTYDGMGRLIGVRPASYVSSSSYSAVTNAESVTYTYNSNGLLSTITTESTTYSFTYDAFGNTSSVNAGDNTVASYTYNSGNGKLNTVEYGNGFTVEYVYNDLELLSEIWYTNNGTRYKAYEYKYTDDGQVHALIDNVNNQTTVYKYDNDGRFVGFIEYDNDDFYHDLSSQISYNDKGLVDFVYYTVNHLNGVSEDASTWSYFYAYDSSSLINYVDIDTPSGSAEERFTYDIYDRVSGKVYSGYVSGSSTIGFENEVEYTYTESGDNTSAQIATYESTVNGSSVTYTYTYDKNGNITKIKYSTGEEIRYVYDDLGQLIREDNDFFNATYLYTYDDAGNILTKKYCSLAAPDSAPTQIYATYGYSYSSSEWGDLLTSYLGREITYDSIGNPLSYYNSFSYTFSWTGRELTGAVVGGNTYSFTYNDDGIRTSKTKNGVTTTYYLNGSQILAEETNGNITVYIYDSDGLPLGMQYHGASYAEDKWDVLWYEKNIFGDIVAIYNESGTKLISYRYDAYGTCTPRLHVYSDAAYNNPFRYRGYYYDADLNLYYLNSRYYDCYTGRFISADNSLYHSILGYNMFVYCNNNPVNFVDHSGESAEEIAAFFGSLWTGAFMEPTFAGEIVAGAITVAGAIGLGVLIGLGVVQVGDIIDSASQANDKEEALVAPPQSVTQSKLEAEVSPPTINEAKEDKSKDTQKDSKYSRRKAAPRIKLNSKKVAREKAFLKGGKRPPIHHPNGKFGPHFHPNNSKFSHWHYYYIVVFSVGQSQQEG